MGIAAVIKAYNQWNKAKFYTIKLVEVRKTGHWSAFREIYVELICAY